MSVSMNINQPICYRRHLIKNLHINKSNITSLTVHSEAFGKMPRQIGHHTVYNFGEVFLLLLGNELLELNLPFRAVNLLLVEIEKDHVERLVGDAMKIIDDRQLLLISKNTEEGIAPCGKILFKTSPVTKIGGLFVATMAESEFLKSFKAVEVGTTAKIVIKFYQIFDDIFTLTDEVCKKERAFDIEIRG